jgi:hypothetical protein
VLDNARIWEGIPGCELSDGTGGCSGSCALTATFETALRTPEVMKDTTVSTQKSVEDRVHRPLGTSKHVCTCLHIRATATGVAPLISLTNRRPHLAVSANRTHSALHIGINSRSHENMMHEHAIPTAESCHTYYNCARLEPDEA